MQAELFKNTILPLKSVLFGISLRLTQSREEAEDIVQDVLLKMWGLRAEWDRMDSIASYCITMAKNRSLDRIKSKSYKLQSLDISGISMLVNEQNPQKETEEQEQALLIRQIMLNLPEKQQQVVYLREFGGNSYEEIAELLTISAEQVKVNLFRARQKIKHELLKINSHGL